MFEHEASKHEIERGTLKWQRLGQVVIRKSDLVGPGLFLGTIEHRPRKIDRGYAGALGSQTKCMPASSTTEVEDRQACDISQKRSKVRLFQKNQGVIFFIIEFRP